LPKHWVPNFKALRFCCPEKLLIGRYEDNWVPIRNGLLCHNCGCKLKRIQSSKAVAIDETCGLSKNIGGKLMLNNPPGLLNQSGNHERRVFFINIPGKLAPADC